MKNKEKLYNYLAYVVLFIAVPLLIYFLDDFPRRELLTEVMSVLSILSFFVMLSMFYLSRANAKALEGSKMSKVIKWHKVLGYVFVGIILFHPFFIVVPKFFDSGIAPGEAFLLMLDNYDNVGLLFGIISWVLIFLIGLISVFRNIIPLPYITWRTVHGLLSIVFISLSSFHVISLGRHVNMVMTVVIAIVAVIAVSLLFTTYLDRSRKSKIKTNEI